MSAIEDALRTAEAEAEKERLEDEGYPSLSGMLNLPEREGRRPPMRTVLVAGAALVVAVGGGWLAWDRIGAAADGTAGTAEPAPAALAAADTSARADGGRTAMAGGAGAEADPSDDPADASAAGSPASAREGPAATDRDDAADDEPEAPRRAESSDRSSVGETGADPATERTVDPSPAGEEPAAETAAAEAPPSDAAAPAPEEEPAAGREVASAADRETEPPIEQESSEPAGAGASEEVDRPDTGAGGDETAADTAAARREEPSGDRPEPAPAAVAQPVPADERAESEAGPEEARKLFRQGVRLSDAGDAEGAVERYRRAIRADSSYVEAWNNLGILLDRLERPAEAEEALREALRRRPEYPSARTNLGIVLLEQDRPEEAVEAFREVLVGGRASFEVYANLGVAYRQMGRLPSARRALERALEIAPDEPLAHYHFARVLEASGDRLDAVEHYRAFLDAGAGSRDLRVRVRRHVEYLRRHPGGG